MSPSASIENVLYKAFPPRVVGGKVAPHECEECDALNKQLVGITWPDVPPDFAAENDGALTLLTDEAYVAFLPAWLRCAVLDPDGPVASMIPIILESARVRDAFTDEQAAAIVDVIRFTTSESAFGSDDEVNAEHFANISRIYGVR